MGRDPSFKEIAFELSKEKKKKETKNKKKKKLGVPLVKKIENVLALADVLSLNTLLFEEGGGIHQYIPDKRVMPIDEQIIENDQWGLVKGIISDGVLEPIERDVLRKRFFGGEAGDGRTLKDVGEEYSLSRERIRQIQEQALAKIRREIERRKRQQRFVENVGLRLFN